MEITDNLGSQPKVMLIDDTEVDNFISKKAIKSTDFTNDILEYYTGESALEYLTKHHDKQDQIPAIIFLDIHMPAMDGFDFMEKFKQLPQNVIEACKVIMLSSTIDQKDILKANQIGYVYKFLTKPLTKDQLQKLKLELNATIH